MLATSQSDALVRLIEEAKERETLSTAFKTAEKILANAADPAKRVLKTDNAALQKRLLSLTGADAMLISFGFVADAGTLTFDEAADSAAARAAVAQASMIFEAIASAIIQIGDSNAPAQAKECLKLCGTYVSNIVGAEEEVAASRRRIGAANKALNSRILGVSGGASLFASCGFLAEPEHGEPEAYVNGLEANLLRVVFASLEKAPALWAELAATRTASGGGDDAGAAAGGGGGGGPKVTPDAPSVAVESIVIKSLPSRTQLMATVESRDMQPGLCKSDDGYRVELHTYQCAARRWTLVGSVEIPGGDFVWEGGGGGGGGGGKGFGPHGGFLILVDLGNAHGTGKPVEMRVPLEPDGNVNEYTASRDFISGHEAESYANHKEPLLNMNWLEEIARKIRAAAEPVLKTAASLKVAMEAQH